MQLQLNNTGAWKTVIHFQPDDLDAVQAGTHLLGVVASERAPVFRIITTHGEKTLVHMDWSHEHGWRVA